MNRTGVLSDTSIREKSLNNFFPVPTQSVRNVMGPKDPSVFVSRREKFFRAQPQVIPQFIAENGAKGDGMGRTIARDMILKDVQEKTKMKGNYDSLKPAPLLRGSLTQNFTRKNLRRMLEVVERPQREAVYSMQAPIGRSHLQPHTVSRILTLGNTSAVLPPGGAPASSVGATSVGRYSGVTGSESTENEPVTPMRVDPSFRDAVTSPWYAHVASMMERTIEEIRDPYRSPSQVFEMAERRLRSGSRQITGMGVGPPLVEERVLNPGVGEPGPSRIVPAPKVSSNEEQKYLTR